MAWDLLREMTHKVMEAEKPSKISTAKWGQKSNHEGFRALQAFGTTSWVLKVCEFRGLWGNYQSSKAEELDVFF